MVCKDEWAASEAPAAPMEAVLGHVREAAAGVAETGWRGGGCRAWLWAAVIAEAAAFRIAGSGGAAAMPALVGEPVGPAITHDRFPTCARTPDRQACWIHPRRDSESEVDRAAGGEEAGGCPLSSSRSGFAWWRRHESGSVHRQTRRSYEAGPRPVVGLILAEGEDRRCPWTE